MAYLTWITDDLLKQAVKNVLEKGLIAKKNAPQNFNKNVVDPFGSLFEMSAFGLARFDDWKEQELNRQAQKTLQNHIGNLHQDILGNVKGWQNLKVGSNAGSDLVCTDQKIVAEIKNKYNTLTGAKQVTLYREFDNLISPKASSYHGYTAYYVTIIPKSPIRFDKEFTPSDKEKGARCFTNPKIRMIDGASFYALVTGVDNALEQFYKVLPQVIEEIMKNDFSMPNFEIKDKQNFAKIFAQAFLEK